MLVLRGVQHIVNEHKAHCHSCGHKFDYDTARPLRHPPAAAPKRAAAIAASWTDERVAAARATRHGVRVVDPRGRRSSYKSVREAFVALALPLGQHIKFRALLKRIGSATFSGFVFELA